MKRLSFLIQAVLCLLVLFHFQTCTTEICEFDTISPVVGLASKSSKYDQQCVTTTGIVTDKFSTAILKLYTLADTAGNTLSVTVPITNAMPIVGDEVVICGQLNEIFNLGETIKWAVLTESKRMTIQRDDADAEVPVPAIINDHNDSRPPTGGYSSY